jgi:hypothetical protein
MSIEKWVANASDDYVVDMINYGDDCLAMLIWSALGSDKSPASNDRMIRIHQRGVGMRLVNVTNSKEYKVFEAHEKMLPDNFKAEIIPAVELPEVGSLVNGTHLCIDNEDASFPICLANDKIRPVFNGELKQYCWAPTQAQAQGVV